MNGSSFQVTENLEAALLALRSSSKDRILWVDAICIDQFNTMERNEQVQHMADIYRTATKVVVWLGVEADDSPLAFSFVRDIYENGDDWLKEFLQQPDSIPSLRALNCLYGRDYWTRMWVIQEVACASDVIVYCGKDFADWSILEDAIHGEHLYYLTNFHDDDHYGALIGSGPKSLDVKGFELASMILQHRDKEALDPRDKIFALVGIALPLQDPGFVDYSRSVRDVYMDIVRVVVTQSRSLDILGSVDAGRVSEYELPSWPQDWTSRLVAYRPMYNDLLHFEASGSTQPVVTFAGDILNAKGYVVGLLERVGRSFLTERIRLPELHNVAEAFYDWQQLIISILGDSSDAQSTFVRTIYMFKPIDSKKIEECLRDFVTVSVNLLPNTPIPPHLIRFAPTGEVKASTSSMELIDRASLLSSVARMNNRSLITFGGHIGLARGRPMVGDMVCVLLGCSCPVLLRPREKGYFIISEALVDGFMFGEGMKGLEEGKYKPQDFDIH